MCGSCSSGYGLAAPFKCVKCSSKAGAVVVFLGGLLVLLVFTGIGIQLTVASNRDLASNLNSTSTCQEPCAGDVMRLLTVFLQYVSILGTLPVALPKPLPGFMSGADWLFAGTSAASSTWLLTPFECVLRGAKVPAPVLQLIVQLCTPLVVAAVEVFVFLAAYACCCRSQRQSLHVTVVLLMSAFNTFPAWLRAVFSFFNCYEIQDPSLPSSLWWVPAMSQGCYVGYHRVWAFALGLPCLLICCAVPVAVLVGMWSNRARLSDPDFSARFGHLYRLYSDRAYWWESTMLTQTISLVALSVFAAQIGTYIAVLLVGVVLAIGLQLLHVVKPYAEGASLLYRIHMFLLYCLLLDVFVLLLMYANPTRADQAYAVGTGQTVAAVFAVVVNAAFVAACCFWMVRLFLAGPGGVALRGVWKRCVARGVGKARGAPRRRMQGGVA